MKDMRPTTSKVMLALFNILGPLSGRAFLDLFAGSGQVAAEAARRGAARVSAVEADKKRFADMVKKLPKSVSAICMDVRRALPRFVKNGEKFDIIFADPPYNLGWAREFPELIEKNAGALAPRGVIIFEHSDRETIKELDAAVWERQERVYGGTVLSIYSRRNEGNDQSCISRIL